MTLKIEDEMKQETGRSERNHEFITCIYIYYKFVEQIANMTVIINSLIKSSINSFFMERPKENEIL